MDWTFSIGTLSFGILDIITLVIVLIGAISGCIPGFSVSATRLVGFLAAMPIALLFTKDLASFIAERTDLPIFWSTLIVFVALSLVDFIEERDWLFAAITATVLAVIVTSSLATPL